MKRKKHTINSPNVQVLKNLDALQKGEKMGTTSVSGTHLILITTCVMMLGQ